MSIISIRLSDKLLHELDHNANAIHIPRTEYIRLAIEQMNNTLKNKTRAAQIKKASLRVREESKRINKEFSKIEHDPEN
jgi:metal-responsive CopG/Arc/MetJ family transcriptional regulator